MYVEHVEQIEPVVLKIQGLLRKIDCLYLPSSSRRDVQSILVHQASDEIDRALPSPPDHSQRTTAIALMIARAMALDTSNLHHLELAALLHDIGLLMLPTQFRVNCESLELESYIAIQNHSRLGATLLEPFSFLKEASILIARHHERWDGSGYPYGINGQFIPLGARILSIADAFDAIEVPDVSDPTSRNRIALRILRVASGTQFDPFIVKVLAETLAGDPARHLLRGNH